MRIEVAKSDFLHVDAKNRAHLSYRLRFWDEKNNTIEGKPVQVYEKDSGKSAERKISDDNTNIDGEVEIRVVFDLISETQKLLMAVIDDQKREIVLPVDMSNPMIRHHVDALLHKVEAEKLMAQMKINADRLNRCKELGNFQEKIGIGRLFIGTGWVLVDHSGAVVSPEYKEIKSFDEQKNQALAQEKEGEWFVYINQRGEIIDESLGLPIIHVPNGVNVNSLSFAKPTITTGQYTEEVSLRPWQKDFSDYLEVCVKLSAVDCDLRYRNQTLPREPGFDLFGKKEEANKIKIQNLETQRREQIEQIRARLHKFLNTHGIPIEKPANPKTESQRSRYLFDTEISGKHYLYAFRNIKITEKEKEIGLARTGSGYLDGCPTVPDITEEESEAIKKYLEKLFHEKIVKAFESSGSTVNPEALKHTGEKVLTLVLKKISTNVDLSTICNFLEAHPRFTARIFINGKLHFRLNKELLNTNLYEEKQVEFDSATMNQSHTIQIDIEDGCGVAKCVSRQTTSPPCSKITWSNGKPHPTEQLVQLPNSQLLTMGTLSGKLFDKSALSKSRPKK
jgi:hypothetical protein